MAPYRVNAILYTYLCIVLTLTLIFTQKEKDSQFKIIPTKMASQAKIVDLYDGAIHLSMNYVLYKGPNCCGSWTVIHITSIVLLRYNAQR
jgi:hypothetical protein